MDTDEMNPIDQVIANRKDRMAKDQERNDLASKMGQRFDGASSHSAQTISDNISGELRKGVRVNNLHEISQPNSHQSVTIGLHGLEHLDIESATIHGLDTLIESVEELAKVTSQAMKEILAAVGKLQSPAVTVHPPSITVPKPEVTVNVPEPRITIKPNITVQAPKETQKKVNLMEEIEIYREGILDGVEERYSDGTVHTETGWATGKIKHKYD